MLGNEKSLITKERKEEDTKKDNGNYFVLSNFRLP